MGRWADGPMGQCFRWPDDRVAVLDVRPTHAPAPSAARTGRLAPPTRHLPLARRGLFRVLANPLGAPQSRPACAGRPAQRHEDARAGVCLEESHDARPQVVQRRRSDPHPLMSATWMCVLNRVAPRRPARERSAPVRSARNRFARERFAPRRSAPTSLAPRDPAPVRSASDNRAFMRSAPFRNAPVRDAPRNFARRSPASYMWAPSSLAPDKSAQDRWTLCMRASRRSAPTQPRPVQPGATQVRGDQPPRPV